MPLRSSQANKQRTAIFQCAANFLKARRLRWPIVEIANGKCLRELLVGKRQLLDRRLKQPHSSGFHRRLIARYRLIDHHIGRINTRDAASRGLFDKQLNRPPGPKTKLQNQVVRLNAAIRRQADSYAHFLDSSTIQLIFRASRKAFENILRAN